MDFSFRLEPRHFIEKETETATLGSLKATSFKYGTGVEALRISNEVGEIVLLPFQGQQIWDATFYDRRLTMGSMFREPVPGVPYLRTYGAFLIHCGFTAMGGPTGSDYHPLHGELPNARYTEARLIGGEDDRGRYLGLTGRYRHTEAFSYNYVAEPEVRLYEKSGKLRVTFRATNEKATPMEYMYLCHANFHPHDGGELKYTAPCDTDHIRVRSNIPAHITPDPKYVAFLKELADRPEKHNRFSPEAVYDPEAVLFIDMQSDENGLAHAMQLLPSGEGDFISYDPVTLDHAVRWISRTKDQQAVGIVLPATAEPDGYTKEKEKGNIKLLGPGERFETTMELGALTAKEASALDEKIRRVLG